MKKMILAAAVLAAASFGASAAENTVAANNISYTYAQATYNSTTIDMDLNSNVDFNGWGVKGSYEFADQFHVFGAYSKVNNNDFVDLDLMESQLGLGWHKSVAENADAVLELSAIRQEVKASLFGFSSKDHLNGYKASAGFRSAFNEHLVGNIMLNMVDGSDMEREFSPSAGVEVKFNPMWSLVIDGEKNEDMKRYSVGVRANF